MDDNSHATDRIVVVGSGFGVWMANRHIASGRWGDVIEVRAIRHDASSSSRVNLVVIIRDGSEVSVNGSVSGYQSFLADAEELLPGMRNSSEWLPPILIADRSANGTPTETVIFKRKEGRQ